MKAAIVTVISLAIFSMSFCVTNKKDEFYSKSSVYNKSLYLDKENDVLYICYSTLAETQYYSPGITVSLKNEEVFIKFVRTHIHDDKYVVDFESEYISRLDTTLLPQELDFLNSKLLVRIELNKVKPKMGDISEDWIIDLSDL